MFDYSLFLLDYCFKLDAQFFSYWQICSVIFGNLDTMLNISSILHHLVALLTFNTSLVFDNFMHNVV